MGRAFRDRTGERHQHLLVLEYVGQDASKSKRSLWRCQCDCGGEAVVRGDKLTDERAKSCGCLNYWRSPNPHGNRGLPIETLREFGLTGDSVTSGIVAAVSHFKRYQRGARCRGHEWYLSFREFQDITQSGCYYCGILPCPTYHGRLRRAPEYRANGIDRIDSGKGYEQGNVRPCCTMCNKAKGSMASDEFMNWIANLATHWQSKVNSLISV